MYNQLLTGIFSAANIHTPKEQEEYLEALKPVMTKLHHAFRTQKVFVDYRDPLVQVCYLLRYFPPYSQLIGRVLNDSFLSSHKVFSLNDNKNIKAVFIGPGPCPEVAGFFAYANKDSPVRNVVAHLYDKYTESWKYARSIIKNSSLFQTSGYCVFNEHQADLTDSGFIDRVSSHIAEADFVILQNCLNEIINADNTHEIESRLLRIIEAVARDKSIGFIDRNGYEKVKELLKRVENIVVKSGIGKVFLSVSNEPPRFDGVDFTYNSLPLSLYGAGMLFDNVSDGRQPSRYVNYIRSVIRKV